MAACDETEWEITLRIDGDPDREETISFKEISITGGVIVGKVFNGPSIPENFMSILRGHCTPAMSTGRPDMSHLEFVFNVRDLRGNLKVLHLQGIGYLPPIAGAIKKQFRGHFRCYLPYSGGPFSFIDTDPVADARLDNLVFDEGDTGTGNGQQT